MEKELKELGFVDFKDHFKYYLTEDLSVFIEIDYTKNVYITKFGMYIYIFDYEYNKLKQLIELLSK